MFISARFKLWNYVVKKPWGSIYARVYAEKLHKTGYWPLISFISHTFNLVKKGSLPVITVRLIFGFSLYVAHMWSKTGHLINPSASMGGKQRPWRDQHYNLIAENYILSGRNSNKKPFYQVTMRYSNHLKDELCCLSLLWSDSKFEFQSGISEEFR